MKETVSGAFFVKKIRKIIFIMYIGEWKQNIEKTEMIRINSYFVVTIATIKYTFRKSQNSIAQQEKLIYLHFMIHLKFSRPPSLNEAYSGYPRRHKSDKYKEWEITAEKELKTQEKYEIEGDNWLSAMYILWIDLHYKNGEKRKIDVCNYEKIVTDFLCKKIP